MALVNITSAPSSVGKKTMTISDLGGVDLTNSPLFVADNRASNMRNFIKEYGATQKRFGWKEIFQFTPTLDIEKNVISSAKVNGLWEFDTSYVDINGAYQTRHHIVAHVGKKIYTLSSLVGDDIVANEIVQVGTNYSKILDNKSFGVVGVGKLYILCGDFLTIGYYNGVLEAHRVEDDTDTYIPTTTIGIVCNSHVVSSSDDYSNIRITYENVNLMTRFRWNRLLGETSEAVTTNGINEFSYLLDGHTTDTSTIQVYKLLANGSKENVDKSSYTIDNNGDNTKITFTNNIPPIIEGQDNIYVKYEVYNQNNASKINECKFGILYGMNNVKDRLFVSGNVKYPNIDWRSCEGTGGDQEDFTYFSDSVSSKIGNTTNSIKGYSILGDGTLAIFKTPSGQEPTIYFRKPDLIIAKDSEGNVLYDSIGNALTTETYIVQTGTIGEGLINTNSLCNLAGDTLMLSSNGVYGIVLGDNVASSQRYAKSRSRLINGELAQMDLENAACISYGEKYYLCVDNKCYIADARYRYQLNDDLNDTFQYEWWVWDNIPARIMFSSKNSLYFGTNEGHICVFEKMNYTDITYSSLDSYNGDIAYDTINERFVINAEKMSSIERLNENDAIEFTTNGQQLYALLLDSDEISTKDNMISIVDSVLTQGELEQINYKKVYVDNISNGCSLSVNTEYIIQVLEGEPLKIRFIDSVGNEIEIEEGSTFRICYQPPSTNNLIEVETQDGIKYTDCLYDDGNWYKLDKFGNKLSEINPKPIFNCFKIARTYGEEKVNAKLTPYNNVSIANIKCKLTYYQKVKAYYITKVFDFGTTVFEKRLHKLVIVPDSSLGTNVDFGYETRRKSKMFNAYTGDAFDFGKINFDNLNFETEGFAKSYVKDKIKDRFNYIRFIFKNDTDDNCKISNLTIVYSIGKENKGVN